MLSNMYTNRASLYVYQLGQSRNKLKLT